MSRNPSLACISPVSSLSEETIALAIDADRLVDATIIYLDGQVRAGSEVLQLFDSWAGVLPGSRLPPVGD